MLCVQVKRHPPGNQETILLLRNLCTRRLSLSLRTGLCVPGIEYSGTATPNLYSCWRYSSHRQRDGSPLGARWLLFLLTVGMPIFGMTTRADYQISLRFGGKMRRRVRLRGKRKCFHGRTLISPRLNSCTCTPLASISSFAWVARFLGRLTRCSTT